MFVVVVLDWVRSDRIARGIVQWGVADQPGGGAFCTSGDREQQSEPREDLCSTSILRYCARHRVVHTFLAHDMVRVIDIY